MKYILARSAQPVLEQFARSRGLLAFDFDGTLAPIVARHDGAKLRASTRTRLLSVAQHYPCAVISGRLQADVLSHIVGISMVGVIGNHGLEPSADMHHYAAMIGEWVPVLRASLDELVGVEVEDKRYSIAIHYRRARAKIEAVSGIAVAVARLGPTARVFGGKQVVNVLPAGAPHKGVALTGLCTQMGADTAIYVGDDTTDEDVFAMAQPGLLSIRIGRLVTSHAAYYLREQWEIDVLLERLAALRPGPDRPHAEDRD